MEDFLKTVGALYDETRVTLLKFIDIHGALCVCDLEASFGMTQSRLSRHLKILKEAGFLSAKRCGRWTHYDIRSPIDRFRMEAIKEIRSLPIDLPDLKKISKGCEV
ncbi:MAG: metalloregulator ArsR/SmtB family transcription factor [Hydrogenimonas sp.]|nr:metalloregulator ArsR/SmtB family transcription factor [Hydrogenimonas sp.]